LAPPNYGLIFVTMDLVMIDTHNMLLIRFCKPYIPDFNQKFRLKDGIDDVQKRIRSLLEAKSLKSLGYWSVACMAGHTFN
jgi:hypothetical protein